MPSPEASRDIVPDEWSASERISETPHGTMLGTAVLLLLFIGAVLFVILDPLGWRETTLAEEKTPGQLVRELRVTEEDTLSTYGRATEPGKYRIPIDEALDKVARQAEESGELPLPLPPAPESP